MIVEAFLSASARTRPDLRGRGLVRDAVALWSRATRRRRAWAPHEARCHAFVDGVVAGLGSHRTVLVLGSGLLRDVPLDRLATRFARVILLDAVHLLPARLRARRAGGEMVVCDLAEVGTLALLQADPTIDLVISANVLSQLALSARREGEGDGHDAARATIRAHRADLAGFAAPACLLTDVAYRDIGRDGAVLAETVLVDPDLLPGSPDDAWDWEVAPRGEIARRFARVHRVCAFGLAPGRAVGIPRGDSLGPSR